MQPKSSLLVMISSLSYTPVSRYYDPVAQIVDVELLLNTSHGTAVRRWAQMKKDLGIPRYKKPTKSQVMEYFREVVN